MENIPEIQGLLDGLSDEIDVLEHKMTESHMLDEKVQDLAGRYSNDSETQAKVYALMSYSISSILFAYLKSSGISTDTHPIMADIERVKSYMSKVKIATSPASTESAKSNSKIDKDAANRFIKHALAKTTTNNPADEEAEKFLNGISQETPVHTRFSDDDIETVKVQKVETGQDRGEKRKKKIKATKSEI